MAQRNLAPNGALFNQITRDRLSFNSYSGTDIQCFFFGDDIGGISDEIDASTRLSDTEKEQLFDQYDKFRTRIIRPFGEIQTLSVSSARSFGPIRRLGEITPIQYKGGARTIAGSMVFAVLNRDIFTDYMEGLLSGLTDDGWSKPTFMDEIPPFNVLIRGANEYGAMSSGILVNVVLTNFGTTFSVDDLYTEATYSYVADYYFPFTDDWKRAVVDAYKMIGNRGLTPLSFKAIADQNLVATSDGNYYAMPKAEWEFMKGLPQNTHQFLINKGPEYIRHMRIGRKI